MIFAKVVALDLAGGWCWLAQAGMIEEDVRRDIFSGFQHLRQR